LSLWTGGYFQSRYDWRTTVPEEPLSDYQSKRDFESTPEPTADGSKPGSSRFVIQEHHASNLHYDLRLEVDGVLKSWAVPKGPSTDPSEKRLAIPTEDHPVDYIDFEGAIPKDQHGGGAVLVWDTGTYENTTTDENGEEVPPGEAIEGGHISVVLKGERLSGGYALTRTGSGDDSRWLLVKKDDDEADARRNPTSTEPRSVLTGRTLDEIQEEVDGD
jgi:DNA ligase D-like protein (predicted 3'-phosphoesterase)